MDIQFTAIGIFCGPDQARHALPRQPGSGGTRGVIHLNAKHNFEQAVQDLEGFERIWVIFSFDRVQNWKPLVQPPGEKRKRGLFATRSPHRPNAIGISCVKLVDVNGLEITIDESDLLAGTPILDLKPYLPYADSYPEAQAGWTAEQSFYQVSLASDVDASLTWLHSQGGPDLRASIQQTLSRTVEGSSSNRIRGTCLALGTWRIHFTVDGADVCVQRIQSGYTEDELAQPEDPWDDKTLHRAFAAWQSGRG